MVPEENKKFTSRFHCNDIGEVKDYVGCKIEKNKKEGSMKFIQPVMLQSFSIEFATSINCKPITPAQAGTTLVPGTDSNKVEKERHLYFRKGLGKLWHMTWRLRQKVQNLVHEFLRQEHMPMEAHVKAVHCVIGYCLGTWERGWTLKPERKWDGKDKMFRF